MVPSMRLPAAVLIFVFALPAFAQTPVQYSVVPVAVGSDGLSSIIHVVMTLPKDAATAQATLIMPRAVPMGYSQQRYDEFVMVTGARSRSGAAASVKRSDGPRWSMAADAADPIATIDYEVNVLAMEAAILEGGDSSRARAGYLSLLGYSVFPYIEGFEDRAIELTIAPPPNRPDWPVFSTLAPRAPATPGPLRVRASDFYDLADSQILLGPGFRVKKLRATPDLFLAVHAEGPVDEDIIAPLAEQAFEAVVRYFGGAPFPHFTLLFDYLEPDFAATHLRFQHGAHAERHFRRPRIGGAHGEVDRSRTRVLPLQRGASRLARLDSEALRRGRVLPISLGTGASD